MQGLFRLPQDANRVPRSDVTSRLSSAWEASNYRIISIEGRGGVGKSSALRDFLETEVQPAQGLVWSFYQSVDVEDFLEGLHLALTGGPSMATCDGGKGLNSNSSFWILCGTN